jgi:hypothetical protein
MYIYGQQTAKKELSLSSAKSALSLAAISPSSIHYGDWKRMKKSQFILLSFVILLSDAYKCKHLGSGGAFADVFTFALILRLKIPISKILC